MDPRQLYQEIVNNEKRLRELLRTNPANVQDAARYRSRLMETARSLADLRPSLAAHHELEQVLWKPCFYRRIEDFRRRLRKYAAAAASDRSMREHFAVVSREFQAFLTDAAAFYDHLREAYTQWLLHNRVSRIASQQETKTNTKTDTNNSTNLLEASTVAVHIEKCRHSLHRCLIFLGDLQRYRELHGQKAKKNFAAAERCYLQALRVLPENGNPHNQLAVLATYSDAETVAVYRYCRGLLIAHPFATAEENLALLFERSRQRPLLPPTTGIVTGSSPAKEKALFLKSVLHRLTRLHGVLFSLATPPKPTASAQPKPLPVYSKEMEALVIKDFGALLRAGVMGDALLLKLVVTQIFCLLRAMGTAWVADALRLTLRMMSQVLEFVVVELSRLDAQRMPSSLRLLGPVSTFCDFLRLNPTLVDQVEAALATAQRSDGTPNENEQRVVIEFLDNLVTLLNHTKIKALAMASGSAERRLKEQQLQLKENIELRGFLPLQALFANCGAFQWRDDLVSHSSTASPSSLPSAGFTEQDAWQVRAWNVSRFGRFLCEEYEGNPLLYVFHGEFATTPAVTSSINNGFQAKPHDLANIGTPSTFGANVFSTSHPTNGNTAMATPADDEFDDEVIVYQPSPPPASAIPMPSTSRQSSAEVSQSNSVGESASVFGFSSPFDSALSFGAPIGAFGSSMTQEDTASVDNGVSFRASFGEQRSSMRTSSSSSSLVDFPEYSSFGGGLNPFSTSSMWRNTTSTSSVTPLAGSFAAKNQDDKDARGLRDLDAVERLSERYQQRTSTLSSFLSPLTMSPPPATPPTPSPPRRASVPRPPPGFGDLNARRTPSPSAPPAQTLEPPRQFYTRNPFVTP